MKLDEVKKRLSDGGQIVTKEERLGNQTGTQLRLRVVLSSMSSTTAQLTVRGKTNKQ
jgi:hypothetical protein